jgi:hypothetical protein
MPAENSAQRKGAQKVVRKRQGCSAHVSLRFFKGGLQVAVVLGVMKLQKLGYILA